MNNHEFKEQTLVMIDIEALGKMPHGIISNIGALEFKLGKTNELGNSFYRRIDLEDAESQGFTTDVDTLAWWSSQNDEARHEAFLAGDRTPLAHALQELKIFCMGKKVIAQPLCYDLVGLNQCAEKIGIDLFKWSQMYDVRSFLFGLGAGVGNYDLGKLYSEAKHKLRKNDSGTHHNALDDCRIQAGALQLIVAQFAE